MGGENIATPGGGGMESDDEKPSYKNALVKRHSCDKLTLDAQAGVVGLENLGNTCFMNAGVQCLSHIEPFAAFFLSERYKDEINVSNGSKSKGELAEAFAELQRAIWTSTDPISRPTELRKKLATFAPNLFEGYQQQDVQEFLACCLDGLHMDLNRAKLEGSKVETKAAEDKHPLEGKSDEFAAALAWKQHLEKDASFLVDLFQGQLRSSLTCTRCGHLSRSFDPFMYLSLPVSMNMHKVTDAVEKFLEEELLTDVDQWYCEKCKAKVDARKKIDLWHLPPVLVVHLKRFEYNSSRGKITKIGMPLQAPTTIDFAPYCSTPQKAGAEYGITCVANHKGSFHQGHYTAICAVGDRFFRFDDQCVTMLAPEADIVGPGAYVLFLVRRSNEGCFTEGHRAPLVRRQSLTFPQLWPQRLGCAELAKGSAELAKDKLRSMKGSTARPKDRIYLDASYTLTLPDIDLEKLHDKYEPVRAAVPARQEETGCISTIIRLICG